MLFKKIKDATGVDGSNLAAKSDFIALKSNIDLTDLKKISDVVSKGFVKNIKFNKLNIKIKTLQKTIPGAITLVHISQYNTDKQSL